MGEKRPMNSRSALVSLPPLDPYENLAIEEALFDGSGDSALFLWQNRRAVVVGRNQDCRSECRVAELEADGGTLARRLTGGGAVYHDAGNLNFSYISDGNSAFDVVLDAVRSLGVDAELSGRNDLLADGRKFSGSAFLNARGRRLHHGTILVSTDLSALERYLSPPAAKLSAHGVASVRSRVCNLAEFAPHLTVEDARRALVAATERRLGRKLTDETDAWRAEPSVPARRARFADPVWVYGRDGPVAFAERRSFAWGHAELRLDHDGETVRSARLHTDSLDPDLPERVAGAIAGVTLSGPRLARAIRDSGDDGQTADIAAWVEDLDFGIGRE